MVRPLSAAVAAGLAFEPSGSPANRRWMASMALSASARIGTDEALGILLQRGQSGLAADVGEDVAGFVAGGYVAVLEAADGGGLGDRTHRAECRWRFVARVS